MDKGQVFGLKYCSLPVLYYHQMNVERVKKVLFILSDMINPNVVNSDSVYIFHLCRIRTALNDLNFKVRLVNGLF